MRDTRRRQIEVSSTTSGCATECAAAMQRLRMQHHKQKQHCLIGACLLSNMCVRMWAWLPALPDLCMPWCCPAGGARARSGAAAAAADGPRAAGCAAAGSAATATTPACTAAAVASLSCTAAAAAAAPATASVLALLLAPAPTLPTQPRPAREARPARPQHAATSATPSSPQVWQPAAPQPWQPPGATKLWPLQLPPARSPVTPGAAAAAHP